jgi:hypothetical protein
MAAVERAAGERVEEGLAAVGTAEAQEAGLAAEAWAVESRAEKTVEGQEGSQGVASLGEAGSEGRAAGVRLAEVAGRAEPED